MKYLIHFTIFNKKMQYTIEADNPQQAEYLLRGKIQIDSIKEINEPKTNRDTFNVFNEIFGGKNNG